MYACNALSQICPVFYPDNPVYIIIYFQEIRSFMFKWGSYKCQSSPVPSNLNKFNCFGVAWFKSNSSPSCNILKCKKCMNSNFQIWWMSQDLDLKQLTGCSIRRFTKNSTWLHEWMKWLSNSQVILPASCQKQPLCQIEDTCSPLQSDNDFPPVSGWKIKNDSNIILIITIK